MKRKLGGLNFSGSPTKRKNNKRMRVPPKVVSSPPQTSPPSSPRETSTPSASSPPQTSPPSSPRETSTPNASSPPVPPQTQRKRKRSLSGTPTKTGKNKKRMRVSPKASTPAPAGPHITFGRAGYVYSITGGAKPIIIASNGRIFTTHYYDGVAYLGLRWRDVSFVCYQNMKKAARAYEVSEKVEKKANVLKAYFYTFDGTLERFLVCFERIAGTLADDLGSLHECINHPWRNSEIYGSPNPEWQKAVKDIFKGVKAMDEDDASNTLMHMKSAFLWCQCKGGRRLKIMADDTYDRKNIKKRNLTRLVSGVKSHFFPVPPSGARSCRWRGRESFVTSLEMIVRENKSLKFATHLPYLCNKAKLILRLPCDIHHAINSKDKEFEFDASNAKSLLQSSPGLNAFLEGKNEKWKIKGMGKQLKEFYKYKKRRINRRSITGLLNLHRNVYSHYGEKKMVAKKVLKKMQKMWPFFIHRLYDDTLLL